MTTVVLAVDPLHPDPALIARAAEVVLGGGLVAFPTETVYGLGADATNPEAVARIFEAKGRPANNPTIVHVADVAAANACASRWPEEADALAAAFWPGPLTMVLDAAPGIAQMALAGGTTVGLRIPRHPVALALLRAARTPIAAPSANRSESLSPTTAEHVLKTLGGRIDLVLDAGSTPGGVESTVIDLSVSPSRLLRPGLISADQIRRFLPTLEVRAASDLSIAKKSPGQLPRHYAPTTPLQLVADIAFGLDKARDRRVGVVMFGDGPAPDAAALRRLPADPDGAARELYAVLHELDALGLDRILVTAPPASAEWSAIRDRLQRASTR